MKFLLVLVAVLAVASANMSRLNRMMGTKRLPDSMQNRIVGGQEATPGQFPYIVSLRWGDFHFCGGSVLSDKYVVTAAHCLEIWYQDEMPDLWAVVGAHGLNDGVKFVWRDFFWHPNYDIAAYSDLDVGLVLTDGGMLSAPNVRTIPLITRDPSGGENSIISGWGTLYYQGPSPDYLQWVNATIVDRQTCINAYGSDVSINNICAGQVGIDACQGDSGGPLTVDGLLAGIVSWGNGCAFEGYPGVYTNVAAPGVVAFLSNYTTTQ